MEYEISEAKLKFVMEELVLYITGLIATSMNGFPFDYAKKEMEKLVIRTMGDITEEPMAISGSMLTLVGLCISYAVLVKGMQARDPSVKNTLTELFAHRAECEGATAIDHVVSKLLQICNEHRKQEVEKESRGDPLERLMQMLRLEMKRER